MAPDGSKTAPEAPRQEPRQDKRRPNRPGEGRKAAQNGLRWHRDGPGGASRELQRLLSRLSLRGPTVLDAPQEPDARPRTAQEVHRSARQPYPRP
eukprot:5899723-Pyramimonas_sp.AAC.1